MAGKQIKYYHTSPEDERCLRRKLKQQLVREQGFRCAYCGNFFMPVEFTLDHIVPISKGGATRLANTVACCKECNKKKGDKFIWECMDLIKSDVAAYKLLPRISDYYYGKKNAYEKSFNKLQGKIGEKK